VATEADNVTWALVGELRSSEPGASRPVPEHEFGPTALGVERQSGTLLIAAGTTGVVVPFGTVAEAVLVHMAADMRYRGRVDVYYNGAVDPIPMGDQVSMVNTLITSITLDNNSGNEARIHYWLAGN